MPRAKSNLAQPDILLKRAEAAWDYRQRNKVEVNEKARMRMRRRRAELKNAPSAVQLEYLNRARKYRRDYRERVKRGGKKHGDKSRSRVNTTSVPLRHRSQTSTNPPTPRSPSSCPSPAAVRQSPRCTLLNSYDENGTDDDFSEDGRMELLHPTAVLWRRGSRCYML
ncbi:hypothetical protein R3P38DRAFT_3187037 [Favolaschia claudopus]|uniref:Uncharacterized protein n=1 Tax=Favolaschia claudopus TaxID=2862362 RepID=A0AAW0BVX1_9AGAR